MQSQFEVPHVEEHQTMAPSKINFSLGPDTVMPLPSSGRAEETVARAGLSTSHVEANGSLNFLPTGGEAQSRDNLSSDKSLPRPSELQTAQAQGDQQPKVTKNPDGSEVTDYGDGHTSTKYQDGRTVEEMNRPPYHYRKETQPDGSFDETITNGQKTETTHYDKKTDTMKKRVETPDEWTEEEYGPGHRVNYSKHFNKKTGVGELNRRQPDGSFSHERFYEI
jgi:hypothetical protein